MKVALVCPAGIVTVAGVLAALGLELASVITKPPTGAGPEIVTVPVTTVEELPCTVDGDTATETSVGALIVKFAVLEAPPARVPVMVAITLALTAVVLTVNSTAVWPAGTVTDAGSVAAVLFDDKVTTVPPTGATTAICTNPLLDVPPIRLFGLRFIDSACAAFTPRVAVTVWPLSVAPIVATML